MRFTAIITSLLVAVSSAGALAWWLATAVMRIIVRQLERFWPLRAGPLPASALILLGAASAISALVLALAWWVFAALADLPSLFDVRQRHVVWLWRAVTILAVLLLAAAGTGAAFRAAFIGLNSARRRWHLLQAPSPAGPLASASEEAPSGGRRIVILCDGTSSRPDQTDDGEAAATNIWRLYKALGYDETQATWYQAGVGTDTSSTAGEVRRTQALLAAVGANPGSQVAAVFGRLVKLFESAFGSGISEGMVAGYTEIVRQYRPGDRIYLLGFSRGAYTARCIAGVIARCGLLRAETKRYAPEMIQLYRNRRDQHESVAVDPAFIHADPVVEFVGVFDTVASLGVPLWGWWFRTLPLWRLKPLQTDPVAVCRHVYHALAMDERRSQFFPTLYTDPRQRLGGKRGADDKLETLQQVWFRGGHADIGGGYARRDLSDITLGWMMDAMERHGLRFRPGAHDTLQPNPLGPLHDELVRKPEWIVFGSWPRWHPTPGAVPDQNGTTLHPSVLDRARDVEALTGRTDFRRLAPGASLTIAAAAQQDWNRTGVVIEHAATYRLTYVDGLWQDAECTPCKAAGQDATGIFDLRRYLEVGRRLRREPWMRLVATVAHPRQWDLMEKGFRDLVRLLFVNEPLELTNQLAPIGQDLAAPGMSVRIRNHAPSGMLHLFANDWWQAASNNSGAIRLQVTRSGDADDAGPLWTLGGDGTWTRS